MGWLSSPEQATLAAAVARMLPRDSDPGAVEVGVLDYLAGFLGGVDHIHVQPDGARFHELGLRERPAWEQRISMLRDKYRAGLRDLERRADERFRQSFVELGEDQQDALLAQLEEDSGVRGGRPPANQPVSSDGETFFIALAMHVRQGYYCDPAYGGNRDRAGWRAIGFDGPDSMGDVRLGRYTTRAYLGASRHEERAGQTDPEAEPAQVAAPAGWGLAAGDEVDVCIVGSGAGGGMAAYLLCHAGLRVAMLERGPWMRAEDFAPDELAAFNRYQIWPDPQLHPRTYRADAQEPARIQEFSPMPALVGGGTIHWSAWTPRPLASDFRPRSEVGDLVGASLVDWPIGYADLEPYLDRVERLLGVGGIAGANPHEEPRRNPFPLPPLPQSRYGERFERGCRALGLSSFPMPQAIPVRPWAGRPASRDNGFVQQYGDSTDAKASSLERVHRAGAGDGPARPAVRLVRLSRRDGQGRPRHRRRLPRRGRSRARRARPRGDRRVWRNRNRPPALDVGYPNRSGRSGGRVGPARRKPDAARVHICDRPVRGRRPDLRLGGLVRGRVHIRPVPTRRAPRARPRLSGLVLGPGTPNQLHLPGQADLGRPRQGCGSRLLQSQPQGWRPGPGPAAGVQPRRP